jgi:hypothetical protein
MLQLRKELHTLQKTKHRPLFGPTRNDAKHMTQQLSVAVRAGVVQKTIANMVDL